MYFRSKSKKWTHKCSQDFLLDQKSDDLLIAITLSYMCSYTSYTATNYLFISSAGVHLAKFSSIFASFQQKCLEKNFRRPRGAPAPPASPGYAYEWTRVVLCPLTFKVHVLSIEYLFKKAHVYRYQRAGFKLGWPRTIRLFKAQGARRPHVLVLQSSISEGMGIQTTLSH